MTLWYANSSGPRYLEDGKFHRRARTGVTKTSQVEYRGWSFQFASHQVGTSIRRISHSATIFDPDGHRVEHLRSFANLDQAGEAAREWIDQIIATINKRLQISPLGNIPKFPNAAKNQEK